MVVEAQVRSAARGLGLAAVCAVVYLLSFELMSLMPAWLEYAPGVSLLFLPAGVKLVALLVAGGWGLLGLAAAGLWTAADVWSSATWLALAGNVLVWLAIPYLVIRALLRWMGVHADLSNLSYLRVLGIGLAAILASSAAATAYAVVAHGAPLTQAGARTLAMALGDFVGAGVMLGLFVAALNLVQAARSLDH